MPKGVLTGRLAGATIDLECASVCSLSGRQKNGFWILRKDFFLGGETLKR
jgi:hypothetical protein